ncbi:SIS domain-containing protein [Nitrosopumilus sp. b2]|uniref:D-sedoheptulose-7-phosphate isomerase n=1 Tax=Nitrosopumilus sp. b2 TaxID=2109908 RepID=UPI0015F43394|nr:SIS domain-containing protein [Nitrosopumilus sp. b2]KAF6245791.1 phosphoheptose isomerase [Nitrosopumilus sp. b2]
MTEQNEFISNYLHEQSSCLKELSNDIDLFVLVVEKLLAARKSDSLVITMGNGGSASTASHFTADLLKTTIIKNEKRFRALCLTDNVPVLTAWTNDTSYNELFEEQLRNFVQKDDVVIAFSGSGTSRNVVKALEFAKKSGAYLIGFTGMSGGDFTQICDICIKIPSANMLTIESFHLMMCHVITSCIRQTGIPEFSYE